MASFRSVDISRFRGLKNARLENLALLNIVTGANGAGKSAMLEAIFLLSAPEKPELTAVVNAFRGLDRFVFRETDTQSTMWDSIFPFDSSRREARLSAVLDAGPRIEIEMSFSPTGRPPSTGTSRTASSSSSSNYERTFGLRWTSKRGGSNAKSAVRTVYIQDNEIKVEPDSKPPQFQSVMRRPSSSINREELAERFGKMQLADQTGVLVDALRLFDSRVRDIATVYSHTGPFLHVNLGDGLVVPLTLMGGGFVAVCELIINIYEARGGVIFIDEVESGLHYSIVSDVWRILARAAGLFDTQVIATTHSLEFIQGAYEAAIDSVGFRLYRMESDSDGGDTRITAYDIPDVGGALSLGLDLR